MLLSHISKRLILAIGVLVMLVAAANGKDVCDAHLSRIKMIPFKGNAGVDAHYDALKAAGKSAVRCLIENVTNTRPKPDPRSIPHWGTVVTTVGDTAVFMLEEITGVKVIKMLPRRYQRLYKEIGVYAEEEYLHDSRNHRRILQRKLRRWYSTTYLPSLRKAIVAHAGNTSHAQSRSAINDWLSVQACQITFQIPQDLKRNRREGIDSCIVEFESRKILLSIDYGWYGGASKESDVTLDFREQSFPIDGKAGTLVTYVDDSLYARNHPQRKYVAHVFVVVESIERKGFPSEPIVRSLMMTVSGHSTKDLDVAKRIFRSVRFQSRARRTSAWSGLAGSGLLR